MTIYIVKCSSKIITAFINEENAKTFVAAQNMPTAFDIIPTDVVDAQGYPNKG